MPRSGRRSARSRRRSGARRKRCGAGLVRPSVTRDSAPVRQAKSVRASRAWSGRFASYGRRTRSSGRHRRISRWRSSTAGRSHRRQHRRSGSARKPLPRAPAGSAFVEEHRDVHGVEPICRLLPIAPSTYHEHVVRRLGPWRSLEAVEFATLAWVDWFNHRRLLEPIGFVPPVEAEPAFYNAPASKPIAAWHSNQPASGKPGAVQTPSATPDRPVHQRWGRRRHHANWERPSHARLVPLGSACTRPPPSPADGRPPAPSQR